MQKAAALNLKPSLQTKVGSQRVEVYLVAQVLALWAGFPEKQRCPVGDYMLAAKVAVAVGTRTWLPDELPWLCGCRGAAGRSQCAPCSPALRDVQQHV